MTGNYHFRRGTVRHLLAVGPAAGVGARATRHDDIDCARAAASEAGVSGGRHRSGARVGALGALEKKPVNVLQVRRGLSRRLPAAERGTVVCTTGSRRVLVIAAVLVVALCALLAPRASAYNATIESQHSLSLDAGVLKGQLSSAALVCLSGRAITLYRAGAAGDTAIWSTSTNTSGAWTRTATDLQGGDYYAIAASTSVKRYTCAPAKSNTVTVPGLPTAPTCWVPSSDPVTATTTWAQVQIAPPCTWQLQTWAILPGSVYMVSYNWMIEYRPAVAGDPVAFEYDGHGWTYYATQPNCCASGA